MQVRTTMTYYLMPIRMAIIKKQKVTGVGEGVEKRELFYTIEGNVNWCSHYGNSTKVPQKIKNISALVGY